MDLRSGLERRVCSAAIRGGEAMGSSGTSDVALPGRGLGRHGSAARQADSEDRPIDRGRGDTDGAAVRTGNLMRDEQSETEAWALGPEWLYRSALPERIENVRHRLGRNGLASIGDFDDDFGLLAIDP